MKKTSRLTLALRAIAAATLLATLGLWLATGAHVGWTQTSKVSQQHDEVTGIDYPVREPAFIAGVEVLFGGIAVTAALASASLVTNRRLRAINA